MSSELIQDGDNKWLEELEIDEKGRGVFGIRAAARVVGVSPSTIHKFSTRVFAHQKVEWLEPISREEEEVFATGKLLDITVYKFLLHYAEEGIEQADRTLKSMGAIGIRSWAREVKGWKEPSQSQALPTDPIKQALMLAEALLSVKAELHDAKEEIEILKPMAEIADAFVNRNRQEITISEVAHVINAGVCKLTDELVIEAEAVKAYAMVKVGKHLHDMPKNRGEAGQFKSTGSTNMGPPTQDVPTLEEIGISKNDSAAAQRLYENEEIAEEIIEEAKALIYSVRRDCPTSGTDVGKSCASVVLVAGWATPPTLFLIPREEIMLLNRCPIEKERWIAVLDYYAEFPRHYIENLKDVEALIKPSLRIVKTKWYHHMFGTQAEYDLFCFIGELHLTIRSDFYASKPWWRFYIPFSSGIAYHNRFNPDSGGGDCG